MSLGLGSLSGTSHVLVYCSSCHNRRFSAARVCSRLPLASPCRPPPITHTHALRGGLFGVAAELSSCSASEGLGLAAERSRSASAARAASGAAAGSSLEWRDAHLGGARGAWRGHTPIERGSCGITGAMQRRDNASHASGERRPMHDDAPAHARAPMRAHACTQASQGLESNPPGVCVCLGGAAGDQHQR